MQEEGVRMQTNIRLFEYRIPEYYSNSKFDNEYSFVLINMLIGLNRATILPFAA